MIGLESWTLARPELFLAAVTALLLIYGVVPMRLRTMAWGLLVIAVVAILYPGLIPGWLGGENPGGQAAHLGGLLSRRISKNHGQFIGKKMNVVVGLSITVDPIDEPRITRIPVPPRKRRDQDIAHPFGQVSVTRRLSASSHQVLEVSH